MGAIQTREDLDAFMAAARAQEWRLSMVLGDAGKTFGRMTDLRDEVIEDSAPADLSDDLQLQQGIAGSAGGLSC